MFRPLLLALLLLVAGCAHRGEVPPRLAPLDSQLSALDPNDPDLRGSVLYQEMRESYAARDLKRLSDRGTTMATVIYGFYLKYDDRGADAVNAFKAACEAGNTLGCVNAGAMWQAHGLTWSVHDDARPAYRPDHEQAHTYFTTACANGNPLGCRLLGRQYAQSHIGPPDLARAKALYERACDLGNRYGCYDLAQLYNKGVGVAEDDERALRLLTYACEKELRSACLVKAKVEREIDRDTARNSRTAP